MGTLASELTIKLIADNKDLSASLDKSKKDVKGFADEVARATKVMPSAIIPPSAFDNVTKDIRRVKKEMEEVSKPGNSKTNAFSGLSPQIQNINQSIKTAKKEVQSFAGEISDAAGQASIAFGLIAAGAGLVIKGWLDAAGQMEVYRAKLVTVLKSTTEANQVLREAVEYAAKTPFNVQGIVNATVQLEVYGAKSKEVLPLVGNLAAGMGKSIEETALSLGKAWSGSLEGIESLRNTYGITTIKLQKFGAEVDSQGQIMLKSQSQIDKTREALRKIITMEFAGATERQSKTFTGAMSNMSDSIEKLKVSLGESLIPAATTVAKIIEGVVNILEQIPAPLMSLAAYSSVAATGLLVVGAAVASALAALPAAIGGWKLLSASVNNHGISIKAVTSLINENTTALMANTAAATANAAANKGGGFTPSAWNGSQTSFNVLGKTDRDRLISGQSVKVTGTKDLNPLNPMLEQLKGNLAALPPTMEKTTQSVTMGSQAMDKAAKSAGFFSVSAGSLAGALGSIGVGVAAGLAAAALMESAWIGLDKTAKKSAMNVTESYAMMMTGVKGGFEAYINSQTKLLAQSAQFLIRYSGPVGLLISETAKYKLLTAELEQEIAVMEKGMKAARATTRDYATKSAEDLKRLGITSQELSSNIKDMSAAAKMAFEKGDTKTGRWFVTQMVATEELKKKLEQVEKTFKSVKTAIEDTALELKLFEDTDFFANASQKANYLKNKLLEVQMAMFKLKSTDIELKFPLNSVARDTDEAKQRYRELGIEIERLSRMQEDPANQKQERQTEIKDQIGFLKTLQDLYKNQIDTEKTFNEESIQNSRDYIQKQKDLNEMNLTEEIRAEQRILDAMKKQVANRKATAEEKKKIAEQEHKVAVLQHNLLKDNQEKTSQSLKDELDAIEKMAEGQIAAYDRIIAKIREYHQAKKIDDKQAHGMIKEAEDKKYKKSEDDQKDAYERLETTQSESLNKMKDIGQASIGEQIAQVRRYIRMWEDEERRRPAFKAEIQKRIVALQKQETDLEGEAIKNNREAQKDLLNMKKDSIEYEIGKLEEQLEKGEEVGDKLIAKLREKAAVEKQQIEDLAAEWRRKGETEEIIQEKLSRMKRKNYQEELSNLQKLIDKLKEQNKEKEKGEKKAGFQIYNSPQEAFAASGLTQSIQKQKEEKKRQADIAALERRKAELEAEIRKQDAAIKKIESDLKKADPGSKEAERLQGELEKAKATKADTEGTLGINAPANIFAGKVDIFASSIEVFRQSVEMFNTLMQTGLKVPSMPAPEESSGAKSGQAGYGNHIVVNINGNQTAAAGVSAQKDGQGWMVRIPSNVLASSKPDVKPTSRKLEPFSVGGGPMSIWEAFGQA